MRPNDWRRCGGITARPPARALMVVTSPALLAGPAHVWHFTPMIAVRCSSQQSVERQRPSQPGALNVRVCTALQQGRDTGLHRVVVGVPVIRTRPCRRGTGCRPIAASAMCSSASASKCGARSRLADGVVKCSPSLLRRSVVLWRKE